MWPLMRDFRFGGFWMGSERNARLGLPEGFWHVAAMDVATDCAAHSGEQ